MGFKFQFQINKKNKIYISDLLTSMLNNARTKETMNFRLNISDILLSIQSNNWSNNFRNDYTSN